MERVVVIIAGPTCSGKTAISLKLAEMLNTEIISADSRQIYKYLDIGTAKPSQEELQIVPHHFIDQLLPDEDFNASKFEKQSLGIIELLFKENKTPIVAGGTGLYIDALLNGISEDAVSDLEYREELMQLRAENDNEFIYKMLLEVDPVSAEKMLPQNWKRVIRALEVFHASGKPIWQIHKEYERNINIKFLMYGLQWDREILYQNINSRVDDMISSALVAEVENILKMGYAPDLNSLNTVGYKEIIQYLNGEHSLEKAIELIKRNTRRYSKRQMTWFRRYEEMEWLNVSSEDSLNKHAETIFYKLKNNYIH